MEVVFSWRARFALGFFDEILVETGLAWFAGLFSRLVLVFAGGAGYTYGAPPPPLFVEIDSFVNDLRWMEEEESSVSNP